MSEYAAMCQWMLSENVMHVSRFFRRRGSSNANKVKPCQSPFLCLVQRVPIAVSASCFCVVGLVAPLHQLHPREWHTGVLFCRAFHAKVITHVTMRKGIRQQGRSLHLFGTFQTYHLMWHSFHTSRAW